MVAKYTEADETSLDGHESILLVSFQLEDSAVFNSITKHLIRSKSDFKSLVTEPDQYQNSLQDVSGMLDISN